MSEIVMKKPRGFAHWRKIYKLYLSAFPIYERKPFSMIRKMEKKGVTDVWYFEKNGKFIGLAATINSENTILIDYLAIDKKHRKQGYGSEILWLLREKYTGRGIFVEIESTFEDCENKEERKRRKAFYLRNGMEEMGVLAELFGVNMELLGYNCKMTYEDYHAFYRDNYSQWAAEHIKKAFYPDEKIQ